MDDTTDFFADADVPRARVGLLLKHFSRVSDEREPWRIVYPLAEVLLLLTCATIASCDDFDDIVAWGKDHINFLKMFARLCHVGRLPAMTLAFILHDDKNELRRVSLSTHDHSTSDLAICQIHFKLPRRRRFAGGTRDRGLS
jgi:hypothetical protein